MSNPTQNQSMNRLLQTPILDKDGKFTLEWHRWYRDIDAKTRPVLTILGQLAASTSIVGQPGTLAQKTQNIDTSGIVTAPGVDFTRSYTNKTQDNVPNGTTYIRTPQFSGSALVIDNPTATNGTAGWQGQNGDETIAVDTTTAPGSATQSFKVTTFHQFDGEQTVRKYACRAADVFAIDCWMKSDGTASCYCQILFFNAANVSIGQVISTATTSTSWVHLFAQNLAPAATVYAVFSVINGNAASSTQNFWFWGPHVARQVQSQNLAPANATSVSTSSGHILTQSGTTTTINVASFTTQLPFGQLTYNSGSVNPGSFGTFTVYFSDPAYQGGTVTFLATSTAFSSIAGDGNTVIGNLTTAGGGGGSGGGGGGGGSVCFSPNTRVKTKYGWCFLGGIENGEEVLTAAGTWRRIAFKTTGEHKGPMYDMGYGELVTPGHTILKGEKWVAAKDWGFPQVEYKGVVHNLHVASDSPKSPESPETEHSYTLANGYVVHNYIMPC